VDILSLGKATFKKWTDHHREIKGAVLSRRNYVDTCLDNSWTFIHFALDSASNCCNFILMHWYFILAHNTLYFQPFYIYLVIPSKFGVNFILYFPPSQTSTPLPPNEQKIFHNGISVYFWSKLTSVVHSNFHTISLFICACLIWFGLHFYPYAGAIGDRLVVRKETAEYFLAS